MTPVWPMWGIITGIASIAISAIVMIASNLGVLLTKPWKVRVCLRLFVCMSGIMIITIITFGAGPQIISQYYSSTSLSYLYF